MEVKAFSDLIDALGKLARGIKSLAELPKRERETISLTLDGTYRLIDTTLNMVIIRLGDVLLKDADDDFLREASLLDNSGEWMRAEREFRLCRSLRLALRETETLAGKVTGAISTKDWASLLYQMRAVLGTEDELGVFIGSQFQQLASDARNTKDAQSVREALAAFRAALVAERQKLIKQEVTFYAMI